MKMELSAGRIVRKPFSIPDSVHIEKMRIENATIAVDGLAGGRSFLGTDFNADMSAQSLFGPWNIEAKGMVEGKPANFTITTGRLSNEDSIRIRLQASQEGQPYRLSIDGPISVTDNLLSWSGGFQISALPPAAEQDNDALPIRVQGRFSRDTPFCRCQPVSARNWRPDRPVYDNG